MKKDIAMSFVDYCKDFAFGELNDMKDWNTQIYLCDLANRLTEEINVNGSATYCRYTAKEYIKEWWDDASEVYYYLNNYLDMNENPFDNPEKYHVLMIISGVERLLSQCPTVYKFWNEQKVLTNTLIYKLIREIKAQSEIRF